MSKRHEIHPGRSSGFTLVELILAAALFVILLSALFSVIGNTTSLASRASEQIEVTRIAREAFDLIGRDAALAALPWSRSNTGSLQFLVNPPVVKTEGFANRDSMFWQAPLSRDGVNGNMAIVGYYVLRDVAAGRPDKRLQLRRVFIEPRNSANYKVYTGDAWLTDEILSSFAPADGAGDNANAQKGWVADGILGMWVRCLDKTGAVISNSADMGFDSRKGFQVTGRQWYPTNYSALPSFIEVTLVCVVPREIVRMSNFGVMPATTAGAEFPGSISNYVSELRANNPGAKSVTAFTRKFRLLNSD